MAALPPRGEPRRWPDVPAPDTAGDDVEAPEGLRLVSSPLLLEPHPALVDAPDLMATARAPWVALHPDDADAAGIRDGDDVAVSGAATVHLPARVTRDQAAGTAWVPSHADGVTAATLGATVTVAPAPREEPA